MGDRRRRGKLIDVLIWELDWGKDAERIAKINPDAAFLKRAPVLDESLQYIYAAFTELHDARTGPRLLLTEIIAWLDLQGITDAEVRREYYTLISILDEAWRNWAEKKHADYEPSNRRKRDEARLGRRGAS